MKPDLRAVLLSVESLAPDERRQLLALLSGDTFDFAAPEAAPARSTLPPPERLADDVTGESPGRYSVREPIGSGGSGSVVAVQDAHLNRVVARKELHFEGPGAGSVSLTDRFLREARVTAQLEHPSIVPVYELGRNTEGKLYYTMKRVRGRGLDVALKECRDLHARMALLAHFVDLCQAIAYAHARGVVHRDIKPMNVMIGEFGETVVLDWGLARAAGQRDINAEELKRTGDTINDLNSGKTVQGSVFGTPAYMSPEQALGWVEKIDARSDVWSLGAVLHEILTGKPPYEAEDVFGLLRKAAAGVVAPLPKEIPADLAAIAMRALQAEPERRYPSAKELAAEVEAWRTGGRVGAYTYSSMELARRFVAKNRLIVGVVMVGVATCAAMAFASYTHVVQERDRAMAAEDRTAVALADARLRGLQARAKEEEMGGDLGAALALLRAGVLEQRDKRVVVATDLARLMAAGAGAKVFPGGFADDSVAVMPGKLALSRADGMHIYNTATGAQICADPALHAGFPAFSRDGRWLTASVGEDPSALGRWDTATCAATHQASPPATVPLQAREDEASDDSARSIVEAGLNNERYVWDAVRNVTRRLRTSVASPIHSLLGPDGSFVEMQFATRRSAMTRDGSVLAASVGDSDIVELWTSDAVSPVARVVAAGYVDAFAFSGDGRWLVTSAEGETQAWDRQAGWRPRVLDGQRTMPPASGTGAIATGDSRFARLTDEGLSVWDLETGARLLTDFQVPGASLSLLGMSPDGRAVWLHGQHNLPIRVDVPSRSWVGWSPSVLTARGWVPDGAGGGAAIAPDGSLRVGIESARPASRVGTRPAPVTLLSLSPGTDAVLAASAYGAVTVERATGAVREALGDPTLPRIWSPGGLCSASWSPARLLLGWASRCPVDFFPLFDPDGSTPVDVFVTELTAAGTRALPTNLDPGIAEADVVTVSPDGAWYWPRNATGCGAVRSVTDPARVEVICPPAQMSFAAFSPDGRPVDSFEAGVPAKPVVEVRAVGGGAPVSLAAGPEFCFQSADRLVTTDGNGVVEGWDLKTMKPTWTVDVGLGGSPYCSAGMTVVRGKTGGFAVVGGDGKVRARWPAGDQPVANVLISPDGQRVAASSASGHLRLYDLATQAILADLVAKDVGEHAMVFTPDSTQLLAGSEDGVVYTYDTPPFEAAAALSASGNATNLRVCEKTLAVVPVLPFPPAETVWAPGADCDPTLPSPALTEPPTGNGG